VVGLALAAGLALVLGLVVHVLAWVVGDVGDPIRLVVGQSEFRARVLAWCPRFVGVCSAASSSPINSSSFET
jgi:hypothetical protein